MSEATFGTWSVAASPITIEYSLVVVEEIRHDVAEGFQKLSRGGIEVGGLLYGVHEAPTVRIMAIRPAACEHSSGPSFRLSERDRAALREQMDQDRADPRLEGLVCVGWYVSHTRTEIALTESDQEIFSSYFAEPWQVTLVVRPSRGGNMRAGFFVWESGGTINASQSYLEFNFPDRLAAAFGQRGPSGDRKPPEQRSAPRAASPRPVPVQDPRPYPQVQNLPTQTRSSSNLTSLFGEPAPAPESLDSEAGGLLKTGLLKTESARTGVAKPSSSMKWLLLVAALIVIAAAAVVGVRYLPSGFFGTAKEAIALSVLEREGQLDIEWNRTAAPVSKAARGSLEIADGPQTRTIPLGPGDLALGKFAYKRDTGDIQVRMVVEAADGKKLQEASRFLGPPPAQKNSEELKALQVRKDELEAEVARLKQSNDQQTQRIQQLERTLKILQTRPGIN